MGKWSVGRARPANHPAPPPHFPQINFTTQTSDHYSQTARPLRNPTYTNIGTLDSVLPPDLQSQVLYSLWPYCNLQSDNRLRTVNVFHCISSGWVHHLYLQNRPPPLCVSCDVGKKVGGKNKVSTLASVLLRDVHCWLNLQRNVNLTSPFLCNHLRRKPFSSQLPPTLLHLYVSLLLQKSAYKEQHKN